MSGLPRAADEKAQQEVPCLRCALGLDPKHPWHDDGTWNEAADVSEYQMPNWHRDENGEIIR